MRRSSAVITCMTALLLCGGLAKGQEKKTDMPPDHFYKLVFRVLEVGADGKIANSRSYSEVIATNQTSSIRAGDKVPMSITASGGQYEYVETGVNIDTAHPADSATELSLYVTADVSSSLASPTSTTSARIMRLTKWNSRVVVPIGKPAIIFSSDNMSDRGETELELTATPVSGR
ncbi:MAG: hypothetical protein ACR2JE_08300 [Acidobacteriaceae bacterium]